jgi:hypothetical protein
MIALLLIVLLPGVAGALLPPGRVDAQRDIERARYASVIGSSKPFDEIYPRPVFETRVARQLSEERVLQETFGMAVTPALLAAELDRVERTTRAPEQWEAIKRALGNDRHRIEEAFCRPLLVERALRARFAFDQNIHAGPHQDARRARITFLAQLPLGGSVVRSLRRRAATAMDTDAMLRKARTEASGPRVLQPPVEPDKDAPLSVDPEVAAVLERELLKPGDVTTILEERDQFEVLRLIEVTDEVWKVDAVRFPKVDFEVWFSRAARTGENEGRRSGTPHPRAASPDDESIQWRTQ